MNGVPVWTILQEVIKCKHIFSIEFAIRMGTLKDIEKLPAEAKRYGITAVVTAKSYRDEEDVFFLILSTKGER